MFLFGVFRYVIWRFPSVKIFPVKILAIAALVWFPALNLAHAASCAGSRLALVIGDKAYPDNESVLSEAGGNAKRIAQTLKDLGFQTIVAEDLTKAQMQAALDELQGKITPKTLVFFFFSGFGVQSDHHTYLIPVDATIWSDQDVRTHGLSLDRILSGFEAKGARAQVLVIDAARRNPFERRFRLAGSIGLASVSGNNLLTIFSTAPEAVFDSTDSPTSPFVDELVRAMEEPGATAEEAFRRTRTRVSHMSRAGQQPWVASSLTEDFTLGGDGCPAAGEGRIANAPPPRPQEPKAPAPVVTRTRVQDGADEPAVHPEAAPVTPPPHAKPTAQDFEIAIDDPSLLDEIRDRLYERGFNPPGTASASASSSASWENAIRKYENANGLPDVGRPTRGLLQSLRDALPLKPWGTIAVAYQGSRVTNWGMSWGAPTRKQASNVARSRCGTGACNQELAFSGQSCGAFALSPNGWSVRTASTSGAAKDSALEDCGRRGGQCRIIGSVCADGSERTN